MPRVFNSDLKAWEFTELPENGIFLHICRVALIERASQVLQLLG